MKTVRIGDKLFWNKVKKTKTCWLYLGARDQDGYGMLGRDKRIIRAHRYSWILRNGEIPQELVIMHKCDVPQCVRPSHLQLGTRADNNADSARKGRARNQSGEKNNMAKLTTKSVLKIRRMMAAGVPIAALSKAFGVSQTNIRRLARRETWRHV